MDEIQTFHDSSATKKDETAYRLWQWVVVAMMGVVAWSIFVPSSLSRTQILTWDSAAYVECARSIREGRGFMQRTIDGFDANLWEPISWWPIGYPMLIAAVSSGTGLDEPSAGIAISMVSAGIAILLLAHIACWTAGWIVALPLLLTIVLMPAFQQASVSCMSDAMYLMFMLTCIACLGEWVRSTSSSRGWLIAAGVIAGLSWGVRYVGLALVSACIVAFVVHAHRLKRKDFFLGGTGLLLGIFAGAAPFIMRNVKTFGKVIPYEMPLSEISLRDNLRTMGQVIVQDMTSSRWISDLVVNKWLLTALAVVTVVFIAYHLSFVVPRLKASVRTLFLHESGQWKVAWGQLLEQAPRISPLIVAAVVLSSFSIVHLTIVIVARTRFRWGELINSRHCLPSYWVLWILLGMVVIEAFRRVRMPAVTTRLFAATVFVALAAIQFTAQLSHIRNSPHTVISVHNTVGLAGADALSKVVPSDQIVLANYAELLRIHCDINARKIPDAPYFDLLPPVTWQEMRQIAASGLLWGLVISDIAGATEGLYGATIQDIVHRFHEYPELERVVLESPALILRFVVLDE